MDKKIQQELLVLYKALLSNFGHQHWWPAESPFEVIVGAILTQSAAWTNVEKGIANLKRAGALSPQALRELSPEKLAELIHSCGYFNMKSRKLKAFAEWLGEHFDDRLEKMCAVETSALREDLLCIYGIGEETADSILLYACNKPVFVIDAYTRRVIDRLGLKPRGNQYVDYQKLFMDNLPHDLQMFNEFHALLVALGKYHCLKSKPQCEECCLSQVCPFNLIT